MMTVHNSTPAATRRTTFKRLLQAAIATSCISGLATVAIAQSDMQLPSFPSAEQAIELPVASEPLAETIEYPFPTKEPSASTRKIVTASSKAIALLGLNKNGMAPPLVLASSLPQDHSQPVFSLPSFPLAIQPAPNNTDVDLSSPKAPEVCSSSGTRNENKVILAAAPGSGNLTTVAADSTTVSLDVACSALQEASSDAGLVMQATEHLAATELQSDAVTLKFDDNDDTVDGQSESLIDIVIPDLIVPTAEAKPANRLPELAKSSSTMSLNIGSAQASVATELAKATASDEPAFALSHVDQFSGNDAAKHKGELEAGSSSAEGTAAVTADLLAAPIQLVELPVSSSSLAKQGLAKQVTLSQPGSESTKGPQPTVVNVATMIDTASDEAPKVMEQHVVQAAALRTEPTQEPITIATTLPSSPESTSAALETTVGDPLQVAVNESITVESTQTIERVSVEHPDICQAIKGREHDVTLVGLRPGRTRLAVFTVDSAAVRKIEIHEVTIGNAGATRADAKALAAEITQTVRKMYPGSRIEVTANADGLTVQGFAPSEEDAKRIVSLVRKTSLQPVIDRVTASRK